MSIRLLIVTSQPIQYQAPWFRALHSDSRVDLDVLFLTLPDAVDQGVGFATPFEWDVPLLEGYRWHRAESVRGRISDGWRGLVWNLARRDIQALAPDVVLITGWQNCGMLQGIRAASALGLPVLIRAESNGLAPAGFFRRVRHRWILRHASGVLPIGMANRAFYQDLGLQRLIQGDAPYFVDNDFFAARSAIARSKREELRVEWGIPESSMCFLFVGKFIGKKHPDDLLNALQMLVNRGRQVHVLMVGSGPLESELRSMAATRNLPVSFAGFLNQTEIPSAYAVADCLVLPSDYGETWGLVVNEAMACGLPAIVSDRVGCGPDLVIENETGCRFRFGDIADLARKMENVLRLDKQGIQALGEKARQRITRDYSIRRAVDATIEATRQLASQKLPEVQH
jgi:glycosyltransferase involved in cell wall biosynthesis